MPLVTEDQVRVLLRENATIMPNAQVTPHITTADLIVTEDLGAVTPAISSARLTQIELYLAAHFAVLAWEKGGVEDAAIGESKESYHRISTRSLGLTSTRFGQQAIALDTSGTLAAMDATAQAAVSGSGKKALFRVV